jgi:hypothetical protein
MRSAIRVDRQIVPKRVVIARLNAAATISLEVGEGTTFRWKYH